MPLEFPTAAWSSWPGTKLLLPRTSLNLLSLLIRSTTRPTNRQRTRLRRRAAEADTAMAAERLQKIIAAAGIASRRKAEELITQGRVTVNGQVVTELGSKADLQRDHVKVDGKALRGPERNVYLLLN